MMIPVPLDNPVCRPAVPSELDRSTHGRTPGTADMGPPGGGGLVTAPSGRIYEVVVPLSRYHGQAAAKVVKVP